MKATWSSPAAKYERIDPSSPATGDRRARRSAAASHPGSPYRPGDRLVVAAGVETARAGAAGPSTRPLGGGGPARRECRQGRSSPPFAPGDRRVGAEPASRVSRRRRLEFRSRSTPSRRLIAEDSIDGAVGPLRLRAMATPRQYWPISWRRCLEDGATRLASPSVRAPRSMNMWTPRFPRDHGRRLGRLTGSRAPTAGRTPGHPRSGHSARSRPSSPSSISRHRLRRAGRPKAASGRGHRRPPYGPARREAEAGGPSTSRCLRPASTCAQPFGPQVAGETLRSGPPRRPAERRNRGRLLSKKTCCTQFWQAHVRTARGR